jgi:hypothetical protein
LGVMGCCSRRRQLVRMGIRITQMNRGDVPSDCYDKPSRCSRASGGISC